MYFKKAASVKNKLCPPKAFDITLYTIMRLISSKALVKIGIPEQLQKSITPTIKKIPLDRSKDYTNS